MRPYEKFGPFLLAFPLGRGGMGEVFAARTPWPGRPLAALKRLRDDVATTPTYAERFTHEAELAVTLKHPNIVDTIDVGAIEGRLYIASELILGKSVAAIADHLLMQQQGAPTAIVIRVLLDILAGLAYGHAAKDKQGRWLRLVHRDVTPGNVLVGYDGVARLTDFGLAKSLLSDQNLTQVGAIVGTPSYIAPELIRAERPTPAADIYSLGAVAYRFLTGIPPFEGTKVEIMNRALTQPPRSVHEIRPDIPEWFAEFVHSMLEPHVTKRPGDARIVAAELEREARAHDLLIEASWVDVWLANYFEKDRHQALTEANAIAAMEAIVPAMVVEKTQVFARNELLDGPPDKLADQPTRINRQDRPEAFSDPDTLQVPTTRPDEISVAEKLSPQPSRLPSGSGIQGLGGLLESGALVAPAGLPASTSGVASQLTPPAPRPEFTTANTAMLAVAPEPAAPTGRWRRALAALVVVVVVSGGVAAAFGALKPSREREETRRRVIERLDSVRARVDFKIQRGEPLHPAIVQALGNATRAALATDYQRAELILSELERGIARVPTSTAP